MKELKMPKINKIIVSGRLTKDNIIRDVGATKVLQNTIAIDDGYYNKKNQEFIERTIFMNFESWDKQADYINNYFKKGDAVLVVGKIQTDNYEKDGKNITITKIRVEEIQSLQKKENSNCNSETIKTSNIGKNKDNKKENCSDTELDISDEIPF